MFYYQYENFWEYFNTILRQKMIIFTKKQITHFNNQFNNLFLNKLLQQIIKTMFTIIFILSLTNALECNQLHADNTYTAVEVIPCINRNRQ